MNIAEQDALYSMLERIDALTETLGIADAAPVLNAHIASRIFGDGGLDEVLSYAAAAGYKVSNEPWLWIDGRHMKGTVHDKGIDRVELAVIDPHGCINAAHLATAIEAYLRSSSFIGAGPTGTATVLPLDEQRVQVVTSYGSQLVYDKLTDTWRRA